MDYQQAASHTIIKRENIPFVCGVWITHGQINPRRSPISVVVAPNVATRDGDELVRAERYLLCAEVDANYRRWRSYKLGRFLVKLYHFSIALPKVGQLWAPPDRDT